MKKQIKKLLSFPEINCQLYKNYEQKVNKKPFIEKINNIGKSFKFQYSQ